MKLTGKAKELFEAWMPDHCIDTWIGKNPHTGTTSINLGYYEYFYRLSPSMQYGVYVDFFKSVNIYIYIEVYLGGGAPVEFPKIVWRNKDWIDCYWEVLLDDGTHYPFDAETNEARTAAIKQANEIFNNRI